MKIAIRPAMDSRTQVDVTHALISAIAYELWKRYGGNEQLNWLEAERHLEQIAIPNQKASISADTARSFANGRRLWNQPERPVHSAAPDPDRSHATVNTKPTRARTVPARQMTAVS